MYFRDFFTVYETCPDRRFFADRFWSTSLMFDTPVSRHTFKYSVPIHHDGIHSTYLLISNHHFELQHYESENFFFHVYHMYFLDYFFKNGTNFQSRGQN